MRHWTSRNRAQRRAAHERALTRAAVAVAASLCLVPVLVPQSATAAPLAGPVSAQQQSVAVKVEQSKIVIAQLGPIPKKDAGKWSVTVAVGMRVMGVRDRQEVGVRVTQPGSGLDFYIGTSVFDGRVSASHRTIYRTLAQAKSAAAKNETPATVEVYPTGGGQPVSAEVTSWSFAPVVLMRDVKLSRKGGLTFTGQLVRENGDPVRNMLVEIINYGSSSTLGSGRKTNAKGRFTVTTTQSLRGQVGVIAMDEGYSGVRFVTAYSQTFTVG